MKPRDLAIVTAIVVIAGFAAADALRTSGVGTPSEPTTSRPDGEWEEYGERVETTREGGERAQFPALPARGSIVFTDERDQCRLREVSVGTGTQFPLPRIETTCQIWPAPRGERLAYGRSVPPREGDPDVAPFAFVDLNHATRDLGAFEALAGVIVWSLDGQRAGWCDGDRRGVDYEVGRELMRVSRCPRGYTADGRVAYLEKRSIVAGGRALFTGSGFIDYFSFAEDGSLAVLLDGMRIERWANGRRTNAVRLPVPALGHTPAFSPDNCHALVGTDARVYVFALGCPDRVGKPVWAVPGTAGAWSPDGRWITVADRDEILFYGVNGGEPAARWPVTAASLAWR